MEKLSEEFGYRVIPDEEDLNGIGYAALRNGRASQAVEAFQLNVTYHPYSANAFDSLADGLAALGEIALAIEALEKAVALLGDRTDAQAEYIRNHRDELVEQHKSD